MKFKVILFLFLTLSMSIKAQDVLENPEVWVKKISVETAKIHSLHSDFKQQKVISFLTTPILSKGNFWFKQENQIRWEYSTPYPYTIIMKNGILTIKDDGQESTTDLSSNVMFEQLSSLIAGSIQGKLLSQDDDYQKEFYETENNIIVRFLPQNEQLQAYLRYIEIHFNKLSLQVEELVMMEPGEDYTQIQFINSEINLEIEEGVFE